MRQGRLFRRLTALAALGLSLATADARAAVVNMTQPGSATYQNAWFFVSDNPDLAPKSTFLRIDGSCDTTEYGYNNNGPVSPDTLPGSYLLKLSELPIVQYNNKSYFRFVLDLNEPKFLPFISLDSLKLYSFPMSPGNQSKPFGTESGFTLRYNLDALHDYDLLLKNRSNDPNKNDLVALIPTFTSAADQWVMLYSKFGEHAPAQGGAEAWKIGPAAVAPEPATMLLLPASAMLLLSRRRRRAM